MGFERDSPEFVACIKFLETIKHRRKCNDTIKVIDLISPSESSKKTANANTLNGETNTTKEHEKVHEEDETQIAPVTTTKAKTGTTTNITVAATHPQKAIKQEAIMDNKEEEDCSPTGTIKLQCHKDFNTHGDD